LSAEFEIVIPTEVQVNVVNLWVTVAVTLKRYRLQEVLEEPGQAPQTPVEMSQTPEQQEGGVVQQTQQKF
jgi:hypothetical protein